jgi:hypothetical protein
MEKQKLRFFKTYSLFKIAFIVVQNSHSFGEKNFYKSLAENKKYDVVRKIKYMVKL